MRPKVIWKWPINVLIMTSVVGRQILFPLSNGKWIQGLLIFKLLEVINIQLLPIISIHYPASR